MKFLKVRVAAENTGAQEFFVNLDLVTSFSRAKMSDDTSYTLLYFGEGNDEATLSIDRPTYDEICAAAGVTP